MVHANMVHHPYLLCRPPRDEDPTPSFPADLPSGGDHGKALPDHSISDLGYQLMNSMARLEQRIDHLAGALWTNVTPPCHKSTWSQGIGEVSQPPWHQDISHVDSEAAYMHGSSTYVESLRSASGPNSCAQTVCGNVTVDVTNGEDQCVLVEQDSVHSSEREIANGVANGALTYESSASGVQSLAARRGRLSERSKSMVENLYTSSKTTKTSRSCLAAVVMSTYFDGFISALVFGNAMMLGVQVNLEAQNKTPDAWFRYIEWGCTVIFTVELAVRIWAVGLRKMFARLERLMSTMDFTLVIISLMDTALDILVTSGSGVKTSASMARLIKVLRMGRLLRPLRTVALLSELRVIAAMIASSFRSLFWLMCIVLALIYCFALVLTQGTASYFKDVAESGIIPEEYEEMKYAFGSVPGTMYSLLLSMTGGRSWGEFSSLISNAGAWYSAVVALFVCVTLFSVLNIVTGVFVDGAIELSKRDRNILIEKQNNNREATRTHLVSLLSQLDQNGDGTISRDEFFVAITQYEVQEFMDALGIDPDNAAEVFLLLDEDGDGYVGLQEFIGGMERIRGEAKSIDIQMLRFYIMKIADEIACMRGMQSKLLTRTPVGHEVQSTKTQSRWDTPEGTPSVPNIAKNLPGKDGDH